jgi:hypothetical protein
MMVVAELKHFLVENLIVQMLPGSKAPFDVGVDYVVLQSIIASVVLDTDLEGDM